MYTAEPVASETLRLYLVIELHGLTTVLGKDHSVANLHAWRNLLSILK
jgi:hypothetical protein